MFLESCLLHDIYISTWTTHLLSVQNRKGWLIYEIDKLVLFDFFFLVTPKTSCSDSRWNVFSIWAVTVLLQSPRISEIWEILSVKCISVGIPLPGSVQNVKATAAGKVVSSSRSRGSKGCKPIVEQSYMSVLSGRQMTVGRSCLLFAHPHPTSNS